jgi:hypothetical protein
MQFKVDGFAKNGDIGDCRSRDYAQNAADRHRKEYLGDYKHKSPAEWRHDNTLYQAEQGSFVNFHKPISYVIKWFLFSTMMRHCFATVFTVFLAQ